MSLPENELPEKLLKYWQIILALGALIAASIELRTRKLIRAAVASAEKDAKEREEKSATAAETKWREKLQSPIGDIGLDAMKALEIAEKHETRIKELETKVAIFWRIVERRMDLDE